MIKWLRKNQSWLLFFLGIVCSLFFLLFNPFGLQPEACKTVAVAVLMVFWWISEALPMPAVALIPLVLLPLLGINKFEEVTKSYSNPVIFLFMGGFLIGLAIEKWNLHKRISLQIIKATGTSGDRIILGFVIATGFISMWISNTATTMMMFPIAVSVITVLKEHELNTKGFLNFSLVLMLVIAYASNFGGMGTIIGSPPNAAFVSYIEKKYGYTVQFLDWMLLCTPLAFTLMFCMYLVLTKILFPNRIKSNKAAQDLIMGEIKALGKLTASEKRVFAVFLITALLWITKDFINKLEIIKLDDNMIAVMAALTLFVIPAGKKQQHISKMLLEWKDTSKMAWGILLLFGGGIALASALEKVGVMEQIGNWLAGFSHPGSFTLVLIIIIISIFISELMSNVAQVIVLTPVLVALADSMQFDPIFLGLPMALAASSAAMMPTGTPPNAIVFGSGYVRLKDMLKAGFVLNLISITIIMIFSWFLLPHVMHFLK